MQQIYHNYELWECHKNGFFKSGKGLEKLSSKVIELFSNPSLTEKYMSQVVKYWKYSTEHNLTNISMNRVAWLGQAACCLYAGVPCEITKQAWHQVSEDFRNQANLIAELIILEFDKNYEND
jgi:hypothetical protein